MTTRKLDKKQWREFFDGISKILEEKQAEIEVGSLSLGNQVEAEWLPLLGIAYDPNNARLYAVTEFDAKLVPAGTLPLGRQVSAVRPAFMLQAAPPRMPTRSCAATCLPSSVKTTILALTRPGEGVTVDR
jgi:hypothetical protein